MGTTDDTAPQPGEPSQPQDSTGDGPVTLEDRVAPGGQGSPDTNQAKAEPMPPTGAHPEPLALPDLEQMNVGSRNPQLPSHPAASGSVTSATGGYAHEPAGTEPTGLSGPGAAPAAGRPVVDSTTSTGRAPGPEQPVATSTGTAHHAPGLQGTTPAGESVESDVSAGAARMGPEAVDSTPGESPGQGDDQGVPSSGNAPLAGSSEEHHEVAGVKLPDADEA